MYPSDDLKVVNDLEIEESQSALDVMGERIERLDAQKEALDQLEDDLPKEGVILNLSEEAESRFRSHLAMYVNLYARQDVNVSQEAFVETTVQDAKEYIQQSQETVGELLSAAWKGFIKWMGKVWNILCQAIGGIATLFTIDGADDDAEVTMPDPEPLNRMIDQATERSKQYTNAIRAAKNGSVKAIIAADIAKDAVVGGLKMFYKTVEKPLKWAHLKRQLEKSQNGIEKLHEANKALKKAVEEHKNEKRQAKDLYLQRGQKNFDPKIQAMARAQLKAEAELGRAVQDQYKTGRNKAKRAKKGKK